MVFGWYLAVAGPPRQVSRALGGMQERLAAAAPELDGADPAPAPPPRGAEAPAEPPERGTLIASRSPSAPALVQEPPPGFTPRIKVVRNEIDEETGRVIIEEEMPLPHVYRELNRPNERGRGATLWSGKNPTGRRS